MQRPLWHNLVLLVAAAVLSISVFAAGLWMYGGWDEMRAEAAKWYGVSDGMCNIAILPIQGDIVSYDGEYGTDEESTAVETSGDYVASYVRWAESDPNILGILARVDSYGGSGSGGEVMLNVLKRSTLPSVALIRDAGLSAAYMAAVGTDFIVASRQSAVGSIGVTSSYLEYSEKNEKDGVSFVELASGKFKDTGSPNKPLSAEERSLYEHDLAYYHKAFVDLVAENRGLSSEAVEELANGWGWPGEVALEKGLIDMLGDQETARQWFSGVLGLPIEEVVFCE